MTPGEITSVVVASLGGVSAISSGVWYLARLSGGVNRLEDDVAEIKAATSTISDSVTNFRFTISDHDRRITAIENEYEE
jgi:hypothetical protein